MKHPDYLEFYEQRSRMMAKMELVWHSNPHLSFTQIAGFMVQMPCGTPSPRGGWTARRIDDRCEGQIDAAIKRSCSERLDLLGRPRPEVTAALALEEALKVKADDPIPPQGVVFDDDEEDEDWDL